MAWEDLSCKPALTLLREVTLVYIPRPPAPTPGTRGCTSRARLAPPATRALDPSPCHPAPGLFISSHPNSGPISGLLSTWPWSVLQLKLKPLSISPSPLLSIILTLPTSWWSQGLSTPSLPKSALSLCKYPVPIQASLGPSYP